MRHDEINSQVKKVYTDKYILVFIEPLDALDCCENFVSLSGSFEKLRHNNNCLGPSLFPYR